MNRSWEIINQSEDDFTVMIWNILADSLSTSSFHGNLPFPFVDQTILSWDHRLPLILKEIENVNPDVLCLMEVDRFQDLEAELGGRGYTGLWTPKVDSKDGVAIFWKHQKLTLLKWSDVRLSPTQSQVALLAVFQMKIEKPFLVAATHLKAKPGFEEVRLKEGEVLLENANAFHQGPAVICGDFNDVPSSLVANLFLENGFNRVMPSNAEWTTWKKRADGEVKRTIDYIWIGAMKPISALAIPDLKEPLPQVDYPSDHLALAAQLVLF